MRVKESFFLSRNEHLRRWQVKLINPHPVRRVRRVRCAAVVECAVPNSLYVVPDASPKDVGKDKGTPGLF